MFLKLFSPRKTFSCCHVRENILFTKVGKWIEGFLKRKPLQRKKLGKKHVLFTKLSMIAERKLGLAID